MKSGVTGTPSGDSIECESLARSATDNPEAYQGLERRLGSRNVVPVGETFSLPLNAKSLVVSVMANLCGSHYPLHMTVVEASSQSW